MPSFNFDCHLPGCTPLEQCATCKLVLFLEEKLQPKDFAEFRALLRTFGQSIEVPTSSRYVLATPIADIKGLRNLSDAFEKENYTLSDIAENFSEKDLLARPGVGMMTIRNLKMILHPLGAIIKNG